MHSRRAIVGAVVLAGFLGYLGCGSDDNPTPPGNQLPVVTITSPVGDTHATVGSNVTLTGSAIDPEDGTLPADSLVWSSNHDGRLGKGMSLVINTLSVNIHTITLRATDSDGDRDSTSITLDVDPHGYGNFVFIPRGTFTMGSPAGELGRDSDEVQHSVTLSRGFWISQIEVTEALWDSVTGTPSASQLPKRTISWGQAVAFCNALSTQKGLTPAYSGSGSTWTWNRSANGYRLPTEAEWEYACRAGTTTAFANGGITNGADNCDWDPTLNAIGWYCGNSSMAIQAAGMKAANAWGLKDMHGNAWEFCWDRYEPYPTGHVTDPAGPGSGADAVVRGGCYSRPAFACRSANRDVLGVGHGGDFNFGFRLARSLIYEP